jgi:hypothetical protein
MSENSDILDKKDDGGDTPNQDVVIVMPDGNYDGRSPEAMFVTSNAKCEITDGGIDVTPDVGWQRSVNAGSFVVGYVQKTMVKTTKAYTATRNIANGQFNQSYFMSAKNAAKQDIELVVLRAKKFNSSDYNYIIRYGQVVSDSNSQHTIGIKPLPGGTWLFDWDVGDVLSIYSYTQGIWLGKYYLALNAIKKGAVYVRSFQSAVLS